MKQLRLVQPDDHVMRLAVVVESYWDAGELSQPHGKVMVGAWIIGRPSPGIKRAAIEKAAVEILERRKTRRKASITAATNPDLLRGGQRTAAKRRSDQGYDTTPPTSRHPRNCTPHFFGFDLGVVQAFRPARRADLKVRTTSILNVESPSRGETTERSCHRRSRRAGSGCEPPRNRLASASWAGAKRNLSRGAARRGLARRRTARHLAKDRR